MKLKPYRVGILLRRTMILSLGLYIGALSPVFAQVSTGSAATRYRSGDAPFHVDYPSCLPQAGQGGSATCNGCCSEPDAILKDQFRGPGFGEKALNDWYLEDLWPLMQGKISSIGNKISSSITSQTTQLGSLMNAQSNMRAAGALQQMNAKAARNYASSESLCRFATLSQGLAISDANAREIRGTLSQASLSRQLLKPGMGAGVDEEKGISRGQSADKAARWAQYTKTFCNPSENSLGKKSGDKGICETSSSDQYNKDVSFASTIADPLSLDIGNASAKETQNIYALARNLYAHDLVNNTLTAKKLDPTIEGNTDNIREYMKMRAVLAKRSVAENSFDSLVAMKAKGSPATAEYMKNLLIELGIPEEQAKKMAGENPSYFAQMETLTRKIYQSPAFYMNLMEAPTNVARQQAAMKSFELMQQRDLYQSMARSEMLLATLLELYVAREGSGSNKRATQSSR